jgi:hypothetical protein
MSHDALRLIDKKSLTGKEGNRRGCVLVLDWRGGLRVLALAGAEGSGALMVAMGSYLPA